jgi:hypothetical protein
MTGPVQCYAFSVVQAEEEGKSLAGKPGHKGMIRNKLPELCPMGALGRHLAIRFALEGVPIPTPGTSEWENFMLWPGKSGEQDNRCKSVCCVCAWCWRGVGCSPHRAGTNLCALPLMRCIPVHRW